MRVFIDESYNSGFIQSVPTNAAVFIQTRDECLLKIPAYCPLTGSFQFNSDAL